MKTSNKLFFVLWFLFFTAYLGGAMLFLACFPIAYSQDMETEDKRIASILIGEWNESFAVNCYTAEAVVTYYPDMHFESEHRVVANEDCGHMAKGKVLYATLTGRWIVMAGDVVIETKTSTDTKLFPTGKTEVMTVLHADTRKIIYRLETGHGFTAHRVGYPQGIPGEENVDKIE